MPVSIPSDIDPAKVKNFIRMLLPLAKFIAAMTPTPIDDMIVGILEAWVSNPALVAGAAAAANKAG